eukprot:SAG31_NODE_5082_length_2754_cov_1.555556_2_plen_177_part_00
MDLGGWALVCMIAALLISRRVAAGVAARHRVEAARRQHQTTNNATNNEAGAAGDSNTAAAVQATCCERGIMFGVIGFWAAAAVGAIFASAIAFGVLDLDAWKTWMFDAVGALSPAGKAADRDLSTRLLGASKWALLAIAIKMARVCVSMIRTRNGSSAGEGLSSSKSINTASAAAR